MDLIGEESSGFDNQSTSNATMSTTESAPILSPSAIANIISSVLAVVFLTLLLCYLMRTFNDTGRTTRIRTTLDNNRKIDQQIAAAKTRAEQRAKQTGQVRGSRENLTSPAEPPEVVSSVVECGLQEQDLPVLNTASELDSRAVDADMSQSNSVAAVVIHPSTLGRTS